MKIVQRSFLCLALLFATNALHAHLPQQHEKEFADRASRHELHDAFLNKCGENHYLNSLLEEARMNSYSWKSIKKSFYVGAVVGVAASAIVYIVSR